MASNMDISNDLKTWFTNQKVNSITPDNKDPQYKQSRNYGHGNKSVEFKQRS